MTAEHVGAGAVTARGGATQGRVRTTIGQLGGYWRPLAGVARLLEELGELADEELLTSTSTREVAPELADLWIITTVLADQFLADVAEPGVASGAGRPDLARLVAAAGLIARVVNYYDGPKAPRDLERLPSLAAAVAGFHGELALHARGRGIDLAAVVHEKLEAIAARDPGRFARSYGDPSTEPCIDEFRAIRAGLPGSDPANARLWGARISSPGPAGGDPSELIPSLRSFARAAPRERLEGYVIAGPEALTAGEESGWLARLLDRLSARDPRRAETLEGVRADDSFSFEGLVMTAEGFLPPHPVDGASRPPTRPFGLLRPARRT